MIRVLSVIIVIAGLGFFAVREGTPVLEAHARTDISKLLELPHEFNGKRVTISGTVVHGAAILGVGAYSVRQGEAEILVVGSSGTPPPGSHTTVSGTFRQALVINGTQYAVIIQK